MRPDRLQKMAMLGMFILIVLTFALANIQSFVWMNSNWLVSAILPAVVVTETNEARAQADLPPLVRNETLDHAAELKAQDMAARGYFAHKSPDGLTPWHWFDEAGYAYAYAGENLAVHFTDSTEVVDAWLASPSHRANVMNGQYSEIGIGTAKGRYEGYDTVFVVQLFGTPAAVTPTPATPPEEVAVLPPLSVEPIVTMDVETSAEETVDMETSLTDAGTRVYETYMATETPGAVLAAQAVTESVPRVPFLGRLLTSPASTLQIVYSILGLFVMGLLFYTLIFEWRHHHPVQTAYSVCLLVIMMGLFALHATLTGGVVV